MAEAASSSSRQDEQTSGSSSSINFNSIGRRLSDSATMRQGRLASDLSALPEMGERTIYVTDEGLIVSTTNIRSTSGTSRVISVTYRYAFHSCSMCKLLSYSGEQIKYARRYVNTQKYERVHVLQTWNKHLFFFAPCDRSGKIVNTYWPSVKQCMDEVSFVSVMYRNDPTIL